MGWLSGWAKRFGITVDSGLIDASLSNFPLPIILGAAVGKTSFDATDIFKDLNPQDAVAISDLVAWYKGDLDESNFKDSAGTRNLVPTGGGASSQDGLWGKVLDFDQTAEASSSSAPTLGTTFTISFWFKNVSGSTTRRMFLVGDSVPNYNVLTISLNSSGRIQLYNKGYSLVAADNPYIYGDELWHSVVLVSDNRAITVYVDGAVAYSGTPFAQMYIQNGVITLGATSYWGQIADCRIFSRALSLDEVQSLVNGRPRKIAVTTADGTTECPVEIAAWNPGRMRGVLYAKVPSISASADTEVFLYYDPAKSENANAGFPGSSAAQAVWDGNFVAVHHLHAADALGSSAWIDSTGNQLHGTQQNLERNDYRRAWGAALSDRGLNSIYFDGSNEGLNLGANSLFDFAGAITLEAYVKPEVSVPTNAAVIQKDLDGSNPPYLSWSLQKDGTNNQWRFSVNIDQTVQSVVNTTTWSSVEQYVAGTFDGEALKIFASDGSLAASGSYSGSIYGVSGKNVYLGKSRLATSENFRGYGYEFRISNVARSAAWIKATAKGLFDQLVTLSFSEAPTDIEVLADSLSLALALKQPFAGPEQIRVNAPSLDAALSLQNAGIEIGDAKEIQIWSALQLQLVLKNPKIDVPTDVKPLALQLSLELLGAEVRTFPYPEAIVLVRAARPKIIVSDAGRG